VDEQLWLTSTQPQQLLAILHRRPRSQERSVRGRKFQFFALACARMVSPVYTRGAFVTALEIAERYLMGWEEAENLNRALQEAMMARDEAEHEHQTGPQQGGADGFPVLHAAAVAARVAFHAAAHGWHPSLISKVRDALAFAGHIRGPDDLARYLAELADPLRDIFGNPFRPLTFDAAWLTSTAVSLARGMYESRDFGAMPILADALQDAGCDSEDVLNHCRAPGPHVRGCWVVDLVLGKS
jgi:hypothetical protein